MDENYETYKYKYLLEQSQFLKDAKNYNDVMNIIKSLSYLRSPVNFQYRKSINIDFTNIYQTFGDYTVYKFNIMEKFFPDIITDINIQMDIHDYKKDFIYKIGVCYDCTETDINRYKDRDIFKDKKLIDIKDTDDILVSYLKDKKISDITFFIFVKKSDIFSIKYITPKQVLFTCFFHYLPEYLYDEYIKSEYETKTCFYKNNKVIAKTTNAYASI